MKKIIELSPLIVATVIIVIIIGLFMGGVFDVPKENTITSSTLTEVVETAKLSTAKYIQHGIAKSRIEGKEDIYILYYAIVKPNVKLEEITYIVDDEQKTVTVILPEKFSFDVEILEDDEHQTYYYPEKSVGWTGKEVSIICEKDAKHKAEANTELIETASESMINSIKALLNPILSKTGYVLVVEEKAN